MGTELIRHHIKEENMEIPSIPPGFKSLTAFSLKRVHNSEVASTSSVPIDDEDVKKSMKHRPWINHGGFDSSFGHDLLDAPVFHQTEEEFEDTLRYIASIREKAEPYGICKIVPPPSWQPPCPLKEKTVWETSTFATRIQRIDKLQNRGSLKKIVTPNYHKKRKQRKCSKPDNSDPIEPGFGFAPGPKFTLKEFQKYADDFKNEYFSKNESLNNLEPSVEIIEGEYWRIIENPSEEVEVLYGADLETGTFGSGFPKESNGIPGGPHEKFVRSGWNLNNLPRLPGSVLSYESSDISGVLVPWLYIGMCFSSFCWHVEDHHLYSMNYMHFGSPKLWYAVPGKHATKLESSMRKNLPDLFAQQPDLLHKLVTQLSPSILRSESVPIFRCVQNPREFILTFPRAYHSGFNCGFNCAEAVNVAPVDFLPHGQTAIELYREQKRKTSISHDKLLLGASRDAIKAHWEINLLRRNNSNNISWRNVCGKDGVLTKAVKARVEVERVKREFHCGNLQALKMEMSFDLESERECSVCYFDLHLSAVGCRKCSPDKYSCLIHAKEFCACSSASKFFLFRYDINDLNIMVEALEGKLSSIYRWAKLDLGLSLTSYMSKDEPCTQGQNGNSTYTNVTPEKRLKPSNDNVILLSDDESEDLSSVKEAVCEPDLTEKSQSLTPNSLDRYYRQKGPRMAKVVRRMNCTPEILEFGEVQSGNSWCDSLAIYPKGFKSRVKYISVLDPTEMCYYISEIQDGGHDKPLFMVSLEDCENEVFIHISATRSWEMVRERVNNEISKQHKSGREKLPPLQPPGSLDAMEMFGFLSPSILQRVQSMDRDRVSKEYWESRPFHSQSNDNGDIIVKIEDVIVNTGDDGLIVSLFEKASLEELKILLTVLVKGNLSSDRIGVVRMLNEEIQKRSR